MDRTDFDGYVAQFLRGWPMAEPTAEMNYPSAGTETFGNGDIVMMAPNGTVTAATDDAPFVGIVVRGANDRGQNFDTNMASQAVPNIVLFGNCVVKTTKVAAGNTVGAEVGVTGGVWDDGAGVKAGGRVLESAGDYNVILLK